jgi:hypothetical protein
MAFAELALAYYEYSGDLERSEAMYLKSIEAASNRKDIRAWNLQIYRNLAIIYSNEGIWDKSFYYLKQHYLAKYEGQEAEVFSQMIDSMPPIENDEMGIGFYQMVLAFEKSPIRAGLHGHLNGDGTVSEKPTDQVKDAEKEGGDFSKFINWDDTLSN